jgi:hypothetical protein
VTLVTDPMRMLATERITGFGDISNLSGETQVTRMAKLIPRRAGLKTLYRPLKQVSYVMTFLGQLEVSQGRPSW